MIRLSPGEVGDKRIRVVVYPGGVYNKSVQPLLDKTLFILVSLISPGVFTTPITKVHHVVII